MIGKVFQHPANKGELIEMIDGRAQAEAEGWGPPFPLPEYSQRVEKVRQEMARREIDLLFVSSPPNLTYLTGYDMIWYYLTSPVSLALHADSGQILFFEASYHRPTVEWHAVADDAEYFDPDNPPVETIVSALKGRGWLKDRVGVERWSKAPSGVVLAEIEQKFADAGADVVDGSWAVDRVRLIKSEREIEVMKKAAAIADTAMIEVEKAIRPGVTEIELAGVVLQAMMKEGGGDPAIRAAVRSGPRFAARHCAPSHRKIQQGDLVWINHCGSYHRYHADLGRLFSLGEPSPPWRSLMDKTYGSVDHVFKAVRPGDPTSVAQKAADEYMDSMGLRPYVAYVSGYNMGIAIPPDWVGHTFIDSDVGFEAASYDPGMITNYENLFTVLDPAWKGGTGGGFIETILMTETGLEVLSKLDRNVTVIE